MIIEYENWATHPFLSRLVGRHDFDGWYSYWTIKHPTPAEIELAKDIKIQYRVDGGEWKDSPVTDEVVFIDFTSFAWDLSFVTAGFADSSVQWRAVTPD